MIFKWLRGRTHPRTGMPACLADVMTSLNLSMLSSMEQLMFFLLNVSEADPKTATSEAPASTFQMWRPLGKWI